MCKELKIIGIFPFPGKCGQTYLKPPGARWGVVGRRDLQEVTHQRDSQGLLGVVGMMSQSFKAESGSRPAILPLKGSSARSRDMSGRHKWSVGGGEGLP